MKRQTLIIITLIAIMLAAVPFVYAGQHGRGHKGFGFGGDAMGRGGFGPLAMLGHLKAELNLSEEQSGEIKEIFKAAREQNAQYRDQLRGGLEGITTTLLQNPNNVAAAQALLDQQAAAERAMKSNMLTATSKALNVLTADQRAKLADIIAEHRAKREQRRRG